VHDPRLPGAGRNRRRSVIRASQQVRNRLRNSGPACHSWATRCEPACKAPNTTTSRWNNQHPRWRAPIMPPGFTGACVCKRPVTAAFGHPACAPLLLRRPRSSPTRRRLPRPGSTARRRTFQARLFRRYKRYSFSKPSPAGSRSTNALVAGSVLSWKAHCPGFGCRGQAGERCRCRLHAVLPAPSRYRDQA
jgi:hypothetical protein